MKPYIDSKMVEHELKGDAPCTVVPFYRLLADLQKAKDARFTLIFEGITETPPNLEMLTLKVRTVVLKCHLRSRQRPWGTRRPSGCAPPPFDAVHRYAALRREECAEDFVLVATDSQQPQQGHR